MSLTSFINRVEIREGFRQRLNLPEISVQGTLIAPPRTSNSRIVGTAFDYLLRFHLERINGHASSGDWIAERGVKLLQRYLTKNGDREEKSRCARAEEYLRIAHVHHSNYLRDGKISDRLLESTLRLAYLDEPYRAGRQRINWLGLEAIDQEDIEDLRRLIDAVESSNFRAVFCCDLNPDFGQASSLVGGADADLILDDCLVDIKTTKYISVDDQKLFQLIGYFLLNKKNSESKRLPKERRRKINHLGIYFSRHAVLWRIAVRELISDSAERELMSWFFRAVRQANRPLDEYERTTRSKIIALEEVIKSGLPIFEGISPDLSDIPGLNRKLEERLYSIGVLTPKQLAGRKSEAIFKKLRIRFGHDVNTNTLYMLRCARYFVSNKEHDPDLLKWRNWKA